MVKKYLAFIVVIVLAGAVLLFNKYYTPSLSQQAVLSTTLSDSASTPVVQKEPTMLYGMVIPDNNLVIEDKFKRNQFLGDILEEYNVPAKLIHQVSMLSHKIFDPRKITPNTKYTLICELLYKHPSQSP